MNHQLWHRICPCILLHGAFRHAPSRISCRTRSNSTHEPFAFRNTAAAPCAAQARTRCPPQRLLDYPRSLHLYALKHRQDAGARANCYTILTLYNTLPLKTVPFCAPTRWFGRLKDAQPPARCGTGFTCRTLDYLARHSRSCGRLLPFWQRPLWWHCDLLTCSLRARRLGV